MTTPDEIKKHTPEEITRILGLGISEQIFAQLEREEKREGKEARIDTKGDVSRHGQSTLFHFGG